MKNLIKTIGFTVLFTLTIPSCASYKYLTIEPCLPEREEDSIKSKIINYFQKPDTTKSNLGNDSSYHITKPDADNLKIKFKLIDF